MTFGIGGLYRQRQCDPAPVAQLIVGGGIVDASYGFALDGEGRPIWPFRWLRLDDGQVFGQRWRLGEWTYSRDLDELWTGRDDRWMPSSAEAVARWLKRAGV